MAPVSPPVFTHARTFNAPLAIVWQAFTEKEHLLAWFGPPGMPLGTAELDLRPGGLFYYGMQVPGGGMSYGKFVYREIVPMTKLSLVVSFSDEQRGVSRHPMSSSWPLEVLSTFEFSEADGQTTLRMTGTPINASDEEMTTFGGATASMTQGWDGSLDQLDRFLTERRARTLVTKPAATDYALTRTFNAPRELVWRMWTEAEHLAGWFGPTDYRNEATMDARTGGAWSSR